MHLRRFALGCALAATFATTGALGADSPEPTATPNPLAGIHVEYDVVFATVDGTPLKLDVYRRADDGDASQPVLLFFHGGGWVSGGRADAIPETDPRLSGRSAAWNKAWPSMLPYVRRGVTLVSADYRLAPNHPEPAAIEDAFRALAWVTREGASRGFDSSRIVLAGPSAGGHLALLVGLTETSGTFFSPPDLGVHPPSIRGIIDFYGVSDVNDLLFGPNAKPFTKEWVPSNSATRARRLSPLTYVHRGAPPLLIVHGTNDRIVPYTQSERLARALRAEGVRVEFVTLEAGDHGWFEPNQLKQIESAVTTFLESIDVIDTVEPVDSAEPAS